MNLLSAKRQVGARRKTAGIVADSSERATGRLERALELVVIVL
jgi:hypothetical protein